jgi:5-methylcytosine-specific restriction endonuclease McrA
MGLDRPLDTIADLPAVLRRATDRLERLGKGLTEAAKGTGRTASVPRDVLQYHAQTALDVARELRAPDGTVPTTRHITRATEQRVLDAAFDDAAGGYRCALCSAICNVRSDVHLDHVVPVSRGGGHDASNLRVLCAPCNLAKGAAA